MTRFEKVIILLYLVVLVATRMWIGLIPNPEATSSILEYSAFGILLILICYYIATIKFSFYSIILLLFVLNTIVGGIVKTQLLSGVEVLLAFAALPYVLMIGALIWTAIAKRKSEPSAIIYNIIIAILLVFTFSPAFFQNMSLDFYKIVTYTLIGTIMTMKLRGIVLDQSEDKVLTVFLLISVVSLVRDVISLII